MVKIVEGRACAKINLFLRVTGRRPDGYHQLDSVFLPISLADEIRLEVTSAEATSITLNCDAVALRSSQSNLATRAAHAFMSEFDLAAQIQIDLKKKIPIAAGLGGGSSDAGAVLRMLAIAAEIDDAEDRSTISRLALSLGADVPFFLAPRPSRVNGIGELIAPIPIIPRLPIVIAAPPFEVSTAAIFRALQPDDWSGPAPDTDIEAIVRGEISPAITVNDLATAAIAQFPEIRRLKALLEESGARAAQMSGSGGAVFGVFDSIEDAEQAAEKVKRRAPFATVTAATTLDSEAPC
ncbi:MAG TPA: 4-(cytidine 5'-diphospho)-2-C-methyl-D-erythritol kinase [Sporolactobacillaceae bacterium]|nr:4-(cytidine 5'-diphospho)-2-C-methyl-D-erythritol kinase [Sporolactobacillaceae bacterium]